MPEKFRRRIGFMRPEEREAENKRMRVANHIAKCGEFSDELYNILLALTPDQLEIVKKNIFILLYGEEG